MKVLGIIAEYNPFHNGHLYHLNTAKELTNADYCLVIMSGDFTQRGEPALIDKYLRAQMALEAGADLVLELPVCYALGSAPYFAHGAVSLLDKLHVADTLAFGCEYNDLGLIQKVARLLAEESELYSQKLKHYLKSGHSYPSAQSFAVIDCIGQANIPVGFLSSSNNILAIEYCKALALRKSTILPTTITRKGKDYLDAELSSDTAFCSALAVRSALQNSASPDTLAFLDAQLPPHSAAILKNALGTCCPIFPDMLSEMLHYKLLAEASHGFSAYCDVSKELSDRICNKLPLYKSVSSFCSLLKTKEITYSRISRCLMHILLDHKKEDMQLFEQEDYVFYGRILGFRKESTPLLSKIKESSEIPLISKLADASGYLNDTGMRQLQQDISAAHLYNAIMLHHYGFASPEEMQHQIIRV